MKQTILFNPHGGHSKVVGDDGLRPIAETVERAYQLNIVTAVTPHNTTGSWDEYLAAMKKVGWEHLAVLGVEFMYYTSDEERQYKGEMIMLLPPLPELMHQVRSLVTRWNEIVHDTTERRGLRRLLETAKECIDPELYTSILWYWPHPYSVDSESTIGRLMVQTLIGKVKLSSPEMRNTDVFSEVHAIEVLNAAHPGRVNRKAMSLSAKPDFAHMAKMAGSDDHHPVWVGTGITKVEVEELTSVGILTGIRKGRTIPMSGLGVMSESNWPFLLWSMLVPMKGVNVTAGRVAGFVKRKVEKSLNEL